jgi:hypothetical protein
VNGIRINNQSDLNSCPFNYLVERVYGEGHTSIARDIRVKLRDSRLRNLHE